MIICVLLILTIGAFMMTKLACAYFLEWQDSSQDPPLRQLSSNK